MSSPSTLDLVHRFETAKSVCQEAGVLALDYFTRYGELTVERKGLQDTVSEADRNVERLIRTRLEAAFPEDGFLGEEDGANARTAMARCIWVVDPIDGTDCFVNGISTWCVSIALVVGSSVEIGVIFDPNVNDLYAVCRGSGATLNGRPIRPSDASDLTMGIVGVGFSHRVRPDATLAILKALLEAGGMYQRNGSGALMLAYVAAGKYIGYYEGHINSWDCLAGIALVREVGGWTNDFLAGDGLLEGNPVLACAPGMSGQLRQLCPDASRAPA